MWLPLSSRILWPSPETANDVGTARRLVIASMFDAAQPASDARNSSTGVKSLSSSPEPMGSTPPRLLVASKRPPPRRVTSMPRQLGEVRSRISSLMKRHPARAARLREGVG